MRWPEMRSEYAYIPAGEDAGTTGRHQIGVSFSGHAKAVYESGGRTREEDIAPGSVVLTADEPIRWLRVLEPSESIEIYFDREIDLPPAFAMDDPVVLAVASILKRTHRAEAYLSDVQASDLAHLLRRHALERYGGLERDNSGGTRLPPRSPSLHQTVPSERVQAAAVFSARYSGSPSATSCAAAQDTAR